MVLQLNNHLTFSPSSGILGEEGEKGGFMSNTNIKILPNGPYLVEGEITLTDAAGQPVAIAKTPFALCRCGHSKAKPFCDGAHKGCGFEAA